MGLEPTNYGVPACYGGRRYRTRLDAQWACFFDRLGWRFDSAPAACGAWRPDFAIHGEGRTTLVIVRPVTELCSITACNVLSASDWVPLYRDFPGSPKVIAHSILMLGLSPLAPLAGNVVGTGSGHRARGGQGAAGAIGWIYDGGDAPGIYEGGSGEWHVARLIDLPELSDRVGFCGMHGNWCDRISGLNFNTQTDRVACVTRERIQQLWDACAGEIEAVG